MGQGYSIECKTCSYSKSVRVGVGMFHYSLEQCIKSVSKTEQTKIQENISGKQNLINEGEGESVFQCSKCSALANKFHIKLIENKNIIFETKLFVTSVKLI